MTCVPRKVFGGHAFPGAGRELFEPERELARGAIDLENLDLDLIARLDQVVGLGDPSPAHLADRQQPVDAADVDEGAEALDRANDAVVNLPFLERRPGALAELGPLLFQQVAARDHEVFLALIGLGDECLEFLIDVGRGILDPREVDLADRQEAANAVDVDFEPALDGLGHSGFDDHALSKRFPVGVDGRAFSAEDLDAFFRIETIDDHLDRRTGQRQSPSNWSTGRTPSLLPPRSTKMLLPRTPMTLPVRRPGRTFLASLALGTGGFAWPCGASRILADGCGIEPGQGGLELGFQAFVPLSLERQIEVVGPPGTLGRRSCRVRRRSRRPWPTRFLALSAVSASPVRLTGGLTSVSAMRSNPEDWRGQFLRSPGSRRSPGESRTSGSSSPFSESSVASWRLIGQA